jgi:hypothetical protein
MIINKVILLKIKLTGAKKKNKLQELPKPPELHKNFLIKKQFKLQIKIMKCSKM